MPHDILLLGLKRKITAISAADGTQLWSTDLGGITGAGFVTVVSDESRVFAYSAGHVHCLDLQDGRILWSNNLPGFGFGLATLCLPGQPAAPSPAAVQYLNEEQRAQVAANSGNAASV